MLSVLPISARRAFNLNDESFTLKRRVTSDSWIADHHMVRHLRFTASGSNAPD